MILKVEVNGVIYKPFKITNEDIKYEPRKRLCVWCDMYRHHKPCRFIGLCKDIDIILGCTNVFKKERGVK